MDYIRVLLFGMQKKLRCFWAVINGLQKISHTHYFFYVYIFDSESLQNCWVFFHKKNWLLFIHEKFSDKVTSSMNSCYCLQTTASRTFINWTNCFFHWATINIWISMPNYIAQRRIHYTFNDVSMVSILIFTYQNAHLMDAKLLN